MKRRILILVVLLVIALGAALHFCGGAPTPMQEMAFSADRDILRAQLTYDEGTRTRGRRSTP